MRLHHPFQTGWTESLQFIQQYMGLYTLSNVLLQEFMLIINRFLAEIKKCRNRGWSYWLTKFTYREWKYYWLTKCINKNHNGWLYTFHTCNHLYITLVASSPIPTSWFLQENLLLIINSCNNTHLVCASFSEV